MWVSTRAASLLVSVSAIWTNPYGTMTLADGEDRVPSEARLTVLMAPLLRPRTLVFEED
jgi:hypothetical protein